MSKLDLKKQLKSLYLPSSKEVTVLDIPQFNYLSISGTGGPESEDAMQAISTLYPVAYKIKFQLKQEDKDFVVMPLEGLWWADNMNDFVNNERNNWHWTYMILQPDFVTQEYFDKAIAQVSQKKDLPALSRVRFEKFKEGKVATIMHIGPFSEEGPNIQRLHNHIELEDGKLSGKHHEIYLSDFRKVDPAKMKTVLRQPFV